MSMTDWKVANYVDPKYGQSWVYKVNPNFPGLHMSFSLADPTRTHVATNDRTAYYFGVTKTFNNDDLGEDVQATLKAAWTDYYKVLATARLDEPGEYRLAAAFDAARAHAAPAQMRLMAAAEGEDRWAKPLTDFSDK